MCYLAYRLETFKDKSMQTSVPITACMADVIKTEINILNNFKYISVFGS